MSLNIGEVCRVLDLGLGMTGLEKLGMEQTVRTIGVQDLICANPYMTAEEFSQQFASLSIPTSSQDLTSGSPSNPIGTSASATDVLSFQDPDIQHFGDSNLVSTLTGTLVEDADNLNLQVEIANDTFGTGTGGEIAWSYSVADNAMPSLNFGHSIIETYEITLDEGRDGIENIPVIEAIFETAPAVPPTIAALTAALEVASLVVDAAVMKSIEVK